MIGADRTGAFIVGFGVTTQIFFFLTKEHVKDMPPLVVFALMVLQDFPAKELAEYAFGDWLRKSTKTNPSAIFLM
jgi:hypothetical protein